jgi:hypothetical protein
VLDQWRKASPSKSTCRLPTKRVTAVLEQLRTCPFSKLNPRGFIGRFDGPELASVHGDAEKWSIAGRPKRTPDPHRAGEVSEMIALRHQIAVWELQPNSSPVLSTFGSAALDLVVAPVAGMARKPDDRPARDRLALPVERRRGFFRNDRDGRHRLRRGRLAPCIFPFRREAPWRIGHRNQTRGVASANVGKEFERPN